MNTLHLRRAGASALAAALTMVFLAACTGDEQPQATATAGASPTGSPTPGSTPTPSPTTVTAPSVARDGPPGTFAYTVVAGDTLFSIAQRFGTTVDVLQELNEIADVTDIPVGAVLFIPNPAPTTTPTRTATPLPSGPSQLVRNGPRDTNLVALTFDMGGRVEPAVSIMNFLIENRVRATLFPTGSILETQNTDAGRQVFTLAAQHPDLFDIGNHSYSHPRFTEISDAAIADELARTEAAIVALTGLDPRPWFRPPEGAYSQRVLEQVGKHGYAFTVLWDIDTIDWRPVSEGGPTAADIAAKVLANAQGGSIVLMHFGGYNTLEALPAIVEGLRAAGYELATVAEVLGVD